MSSTNNTLLVPLVPPTTLVLLLEESDRRYGGRLFVEEFCFCLLLIINLAAVTFLSRRTRTLRNFESKLSTTPIA